MNSNKLIIITGPTATGKTALAVRLATHFNGEIINVDSMQVYRRFDIGAAKPSPVELRAAPHHLIDICEPYDDYTAACFARDAAIKVEEIRARGRAVFVAGGTGLYIKALTCGLLSAPPADNVLRSELAAMAQEFGKAAVHDRLKAVDPVAASSIHPNNLRRVIRAIEVTTLLGCPVSQAQGEHGFTDKPYRTLKLGIRVERDVMYAAIDRRVDRMMNDGLVDEVRGIIADYGTELKPMAGLGYKEVKGYLAGIHTLEEAVSLIKLNTRHYAKRQVTWFKKDSEIKWFPIESKDVIIQEVEDFLKDCP